VRLSPFQKKDYESLFVTSFMICCVAACCSELQCIAVYCSVLQCIAVYCIVLQERDDTCLPVMSCSVLQCIAVYCIVLQCWDDTCLPVTLTMTYCVAACCRVLYSVLQFM